MKKRGARLGQHFLTGSWAAAKLVGEVGVRAGETVVEVGPGRGALTREILKTGAPVVAIEKDEALALALRRTFAAEIAAGTLSIIEGDVRDFDPARDVRGPYVLAANIPYYLTGEIVRMFLETDAQPRALALLVQKEVAERIVARGGKESVLSLSVKAYGDPRIAASVARGNFSPPPSVDSAILLVEHISKKFFDVVREERFFAIVRAGFSSKRKYLANNLAACGGKARAIDALARCGLGARARAEDVPLSAWKRLARGLTAPASAPTRRPSR